MFDYKYLKQKISKYILLDVIIFIFVLWLPYFLFNGKLYIGGDDTKLIYVYPSLVLKNIAFFSWYNLSSVSTANAPQFMLPFAYVWSIINQIIRSKFILDYLSFSLPLILGFIYFKKFIPEFINNSQKYKLEIFLGSVFYIFSPILIVNQLSTFYSSVWLVAIIPIIGFYLSRFIKTSNYIYVLINIIFCTVLSLGLFGIPWMVGFLMPLFISLVLLSFLFKKKLLYIKKSIPFFVTLVLSQSFWLLPFISSYLIIEKNNVGASILSKSFASSFSNTVLSTASGNIIYPLLNLFHRQIAFDFNWSLKNVFLNYYDKTMFINVLFIFIIFGALLMYNKYLSREEKRIYFVVWVALLVSLFLFTVNIGPFKQLFLLFGYLPGSVIFRNFYDKFALGFVIFYSILFTFSLIIIGRKFKNFRYVGILITLIVLIINLIPVKEIVHEPLWTTKDTYTNVVLPKEYLYFLNDIKNTVQPTTNILSLPFNKASYAVIVNSENIYAGTSPLKILTGLNDFSGNFSFNPYDSQIFDSLIKDRNYKQLNYFIQKFNINYVFVTKNIPGEVKNSFIYDGLVLPKQDDKLINSITDKKILVSSNGNYELYSTKKQMPLFYSENIYYQKINPVEYKIYFKNLKQKQIMDFFDSYSAGWKLYIKENPANDWCKIYKHYQNNINECKYSEILFKGDELSYFFKKALFDSSHKSINDYGNEWTIDPNYIKNNYDNVFYKKNSDGTIDIELIAYFKPQSYFYLGSIISFLTFVFIILIIIKKYERSL